MEMAVMFLDISDFSSRPSEEIAEQQQLLKVLNLFFTEIVRISEDYGGTVEKNTGDGLMAYFEDGGGNPPDNGVKRAISCALTMMFANDNLINPILDKSQISRIKFRITIDYGPITIARLGAPRRFNALVAIGTKANISSKMLSFAQPGDIILGDQAYQRCPIPWKIKWTEILTENTGWVCRNSRKPYPFYKYKGRWTEPL
jgi:adenylate cyclase